MPTALTNADLTAAWRDTGIRPGMRLIVHSSLSSLGTVDGGAATVIDSLREVLGPTGTLVTPAFTTQVTDPEPDARGVPSAELRARRDAVPLFRPDLPSTMGAIAEELRTRPDSLRSSHPQVSVAAAGAHAAEIVASQPLGFALGRPSPFGRLHDLGAHILLIGVGHNRNSFLHHAETLTPHPRLKLRRFPMDVGGERVWAEAFDVGDDNGTHFPVVGREFEESHGIREVFAGAAACRLLPVKPFIAFAVNRLTKLLARTFL